MKKLTEEFNHVSSVVRLGSADAVQINYGVFVGEPDCENTFLDSGQFVCQDHFTTYSDAQQARELVANILAIVDAHKDEDTGKETSRDLYFNRQKIFHTIEETVRDVIATVPKDAPHLDCILIAELVCNLNDVFDTTAD
jgi:hypothetical protein